MEHICWVSCLTVTFAALRGGVCGEQTHPGQRKADAESLSGVLQCILSIQGSRQQLHRHEGGQGSIGGGDFYVGTGECVVQCHCAPAFYVFLCETPVWAHTRVAR